MTKEEKRKYEREWAKGKGRHKRKAANKRWQEKRRQEFQEYKKTLSCIKCGENHPACLDFHHKDPSQKSFMIGPAALRMSLETLKKEISKCEVLCSNCHRKEHYTAE